MAVNIEGVDFSFDCEHCAFHKFMELYGFDANKDTCWVDCTVPIQKNIDDTFKMILDSTAINQDNGAILYIGNIPQSELGGPPAS